MAPHLNLQHHIVAAIGKGHSTQCIPHAKQAIGKREAIQVVLNVWDPPMRNASPKCDGGVGDGHDCRSQRDQGQSIEVRALQSA